MSYINITVCEILLILMISCRSALLIVALLLISAVQMNHIALQLAESDLTRAQIVSDLPLIGQFFMEHRLGLLIKDRQWQTVIEVAQYALHSPINSMSHIIWYYKGLAECATYQFKKCEESIAQASFLGPSTFINPLNTYLQRIRRNNSPKKEHLSSL